MSEGAPAAVPLGVIIGSKDAEGVEVGFVEEASLILALGTSVYCGLRDSRSKAIASQLKMRHACSPWVKQ